MNETAVLGQTAMSPQDGTLTLGADCMGDPAGSKMGTTMGRGGTQTVTFHGVVEVGHHMVVENGIIMVVVLVMDCGVLTGLQDFMEMVTITVEVAGVKIMVHGVPTEVEEDPMVVKEVIMEVEEPVGVVEGLTRAVVGGMDGMGVEARHQVGRTQEEEDEAGIGVGHLGDGVETRMSAFLATASHHHLVTAKVSGQVFRIVRNHYFTIGSRILHCAVLYKYTNISEVLHFVIIMREIVRKAFLLC
jgi:hypothetical protein